MSKRKSHEERVAEVRKMLGVNPRAQARFADIMRKRREALGLLQKDLAALLGCSTRTIKRYENGYTWPSYERRKALGVLLQRRDLHLIR